MKNLQRMCGATVLTCLLAVSVSAGHMHTPGVTDPPPPPPPTNSQEATAQGEMPFGVLAALVQALFAVL